MEEVWKDIIELDNVYQVSNFGNIRRKSRIVKSSIHSSGYRLIKPRLSKVQDNGRGYKQIYVRINRSRRLFYIHRLVAAYFLPLSTKREVNHKDGDKANNHVLNLEWCTHQENLKHAKDNNLTCFGEKSSSSKLTEQKVSAIRRLYRINPSFNRSAVSRKVGVRDTTIHKIIRNQRWKHLP